MKIKSFKQRIGMLILVCAFVVTACATNKGDEDMSDKVTEYTKETARVILLAGQSNASGLAYSHYLSKTVSEEKIEEYEKGYENIQISYYVDNQNISADFVSVKLGQGHTKENFGPEIGMAEYLTEKYPGEKFYIIKTTMSGSGIAADWQENSENYNRMITGITNAFQKLEQSGLQPEWFAFCWMQGEGDAWALENAQNYYQLESDLINRMLERFQKYVSSVGVRFIDAGISDFEEWKYYELVNEAKKQYCLESELRFYLDTQKAGLTYDKDNADYAHYDADAMLKLGRMFAEKL